ADRRGLRQRGLSRACPRVGRVHFFPGDLLSRPVAPMDALPNGLVDLSPPDARAWSGTAAHRGGHVAPLPPPAPPDPEALRRWILEIGQAKPAEAFAPNHNHTALAAVLPAQGFAHWRILPGWVEETAKKRGGAWTNCRLILRLYDVSYIHFNG